MASMVALAAGGMGGNVVVRMKPFLVPVDTGHPLPADLERARRNDHKRIARLKKRLRSDEAAGVPEAAEETQ